MEQLINRLIDENNWLRAQLEAVLCNVFEDYPAPMPRAGGRRGSRPAPIPQSIERATLPEWQSQAFSETPARTGIGQNVSNLLSGALANATLAPEREDILDIF